MKLLNSYGNYVNVEGTRFYGRFKGDDDKEAKEFIVNKQQNYIAIKDGDGYFYKVESEYIIFLAPIFIPDENGKYDIPKEYLK